LVVTADGGGSNASRSRLWKVELQKLSDATGLTLRVCHFPPGTSKWNKIEHRLFSHISINWRGRPLTSLDVIVRLIGATTTDKGLKVKSALDRRKYPAGIKVTDAELANVNLKPDAFHGEWNYRIRPRASVTRESASSIPAVRSFTCAKRKRRSSRAAACSASFSPPVVGIWLR
jgi:hypothetical protein